MTGTKTFRIALLALTLGLLAVGAGAAQGGGFRAHYIFRGHLLATPPANATSISVAVEGGNHIALRKMLGSSVNQTFAVGTGTEFLKWSHGIPTVVHSSDLTAGDWITVNVRAPGWASLPQIESRPAGVVADRVAKPNPPAYPLYLFRGKLAAPATTTNVTLKVRGGNRLALRTLLGSTRLQSFTYGPETIFLRWQGKVPTVIAPTDLTLGDRVTVRIRAPRGSTLAQVESTPAVHIGEHEPASSTITG